MEKQFRRRLHLEALEDRTLLSAAPGNAEIHGQLFNNVAGNGAHQPSDPPLAGWTVFLDANGNGKLDPGETGATTDSQGNYAFTGLAPGTYNVAEVVPGGWQEIGSSGNQIITASANGATVITGFHMADQTTNATPTPGAAASLMNLTSLRANPNFAGIDGSGQSVVIIDTGIDASLPAFNGPNGSDIAYQWNFINNTPNANDDNGHGTAVASIIASDDVLYPGVAPGVKLIVLKVLDSQGNGTFANVQKALQWVEANVGQYHIASVNLSFADSGNYSSPTSMYGLGGDLAALAADNVILTAAAGNDFYSDGGVQGLSYPAADPNVLAVGAVWAQNAGGPYTWEDGARDLTTAPDQIVSFSQRDASLNEVFAPGALVPGVNLSGSFTSWSGTSIASPEVAGVAALAQQLAQQDLGRSLTTAEFRSLLLSSATVIQDNALSADNVPNTMEDYARVDVLALAKAIKNFTAASTTNNTSGSSSTSTAPSPTPPAPGEIAVTLTQGQVATGINFANVYMGLQVVSATSGPGSGTLGTIRLTFNQAVVTSSFTPDDLGLLSPTSHIAVAAVTPVAGSGNTAFDLSFAAQSTPGTYTLYVGANATDAAGDRLVAFQTRFIIANSPAPSQTPTTTSTGLQVVSATAGPGSGTLGTIRLTFNQAVVPSSFTQDNLGLLSPTSHITINAVTPVAGSGNTAFDLSFTAQTTPGTYTLYVGGNARDAAGDSLVAYQTQFLIANSPAPTPAPSPTPTPTTLQVVSATGSPGSGTLGTIRLTFNQAVASSFTSDNLGLLSPTSHIAITAVTPVAGSNNTAFDLSFAAQTTPGTYTLYVGGNATDVGGDSLVAYQTQFLIASSPASSPGPSQTPTSTGLQVASVTLGPGSGTLGTIRLTFNQAVIPSSFTPDNLGLLSATSHIAINVVTPVAGSNNTAFDISVAPQTTPGTYTLYVGGNARDAAGDSLAPYQTQILFKNALA